MNTKQKTVNESLFAALIDTNGDIIDRYEGACPRMSLAGNAYGNVHIMDGNYNSRSSTLYDNPYTLTGRRLDSLDSGNLNIMYYRHKYYHPQLGRFIQHDPFGQVPNDPIEHFNPPVVYEYDLNLYEYVVSNPAYWFDPYGQKWWRPSKKWWRPREWWKKIKKIPTAIGWELNVGIGGGKTSVNCTDECGESHTFNYHKRCYGAALSVGVSGGPVSGMNGEKCRPKTYEGWFLEIGGSLGAISGGGDISLSGSGRGFGDVTEPMIGIGIGGKITFCEYDYLGDDDPTPGGPPPWRWPNPYGDDPIIF